MKISKVDHTNTGVGKKEATGAGMLYRNPGEEGRDARYLGNSLAEHVDELNKKAQKLYNVFNNVDKFSFNPSKDENFRWNKIRENFLTVTRNLVRIKDANEQVRVLRNLKNENFTVIVRGEKQTVSGRNFSVVSARDNKSKGGKCSDSSSMSAMAMALSKIYDLSALPEKSELEDNLRLFVSESIRKAYKKTVKVDGKIVDVAEVVFQLVLAMADVNVFDDTMKGLKDFEIKAFLEVLSKDYFKKDQLDKVVKSIQKKNTKVQVVGDKLALSCYEIPKKKALFDFMITYSEGDDEERLALRNEKKKFISDYLNAGNSDGTVFSEKIETEVKQIANIDKKERKAFINQVLSMVDDEIVRKFNDIKEKLDGDEQGMYWLRFFSDETADFIKDSIRKNKGIGTSEENRRLTNKDTFDHLFKYFLSFLSTKYIDLGKGVYQFTDFDGEYVGTIKDEYKKGITSFDYERITADDDVKRDMATYVAFAVNNFADSVCTSEVLAKVDDVLQTDKNDKYPEIRKNAKKYILRFFGGESQWDSLKAVDDEKMVSELRDSMASVRNSTVHFDAAFAGWRVRKNSELVASMFNEEYSKLGNIFAQKYYSNNLPMFFSTSDVYDLVNKTLYRTDRPIVAAVPAFNRIVPRSKVNEFLKTWIGNVKVSEIEGKDIELFNKYTSAMFFILKELYYYGFLADKNLKNYLDAALEDIEPQGNLKQEQNAYRDYKKRYSLLRTNPDVSASGICEQIMVDFSLQNDSIKEVKTYKDAAKKKGSKDEEIYQHYRMLLYKQLKAAFLRYLNNEKGASFLKTPRINTATFANLTVEEFSKNISVDAFASAKKALDDPQLLAWYVVAHFMSKKMVNNLCGAIRTELRYLADIDRRAVSTGNTVAKGVKGNIDFYNNLLRVLEFTLNFCEQATNNLTDYFEDEDDYATKLSYYVDYGKLVYSPSNTLKEFCNQPVKGSKSGRIGIFYDADNPVINRNVVRASMYGNENLFSKNVISKITKADIEEYYAEQAQINQLYMKEERSTAEQESVRKFQNVKNRIELTDVAAYVDIINDLYGQLISWTYLRERDLKYMLLGFNYIKLFWGNTIERESRLRVSAKHNKKDGAFLYYCMGLFAEGSKYSINYKKDFMVAYPEGDSLFECGLELFENITPSDDTAHKEAVALRNYIDHFKYFSKINHSLEEIYGDIFSMYFAYDRNLHKSVPVVYKNILAQYKLIVNIEAVPSDSVPYLEEMKRGYKNTKWAIRKDVSWVDSKTNSERVAKGLESDKLTFKAIDVDKQDGTRKVKSAMIEAHDDRFLENIRKILAFKVI